MRLSQISVLSLLFFTLTLPASAQPQGMPPSMPQGSPQPLPGQAAPIPMPAPSLMAQAPGSPAPASQVAASAPKPAAAGMPKKDNITLADVEDKLIATRDAFWSYGDRVRNAELLKKYNEQEAKLLR
jgi:hypothetical protein